jgi:uncharacterized SAM-binding protein YcdF (DUF218 family)
MLFSIKKILEALLLPQTFIFILLIISIILILRRKKSGKIWLGSTLILYYLLSITPISNFMLNSLENEYSISENPPPSIAYIAVLGGGAISEQSSLPVTSRLTRSSIFRLLEGIRLFNKAKDGYLILSGGQTGNLMQKESESTIMKDLAILLGIDQQKIILESKSHDTYEEALEIKKIVGDKPIMLVTSAYHMPRSVYIFRKIGLNVIAAPCDYRAQKILKYNIFDFLPTSFENSSIAIREYFGRIYYRLFR